MHMWSFDGSYLSLHRTYGKMEAAEEKEGEAAGKPPRDGTIQG